MEPRATTPAWHRDPTGRFEYRYFNGVDWTSDVATNGQRYVDTPIKQLSPKFEPARPPRGMAITSFVTGLAGIAIGWIPFIVVFGVAASVAAIVFGILGLQTAQRHDGYGRGFAITGLVLSPFALAACVGGFFFTKAVLSEFRDFVEPGPHELIVDQPCTIADGEATLHGTIRNLDDTTHDYRIVVEFTDTTDHRESTTAQVSDVARDATAPWSSSAAIAGTSVRCRVTDVFGPLPFDGSGQG